MNQRRASQVYEYPLSLRSLRKTRLLHILSTRYLLAKFPAGTSCQSAIACAYTYTRTRASRGNVGARCYRHIDFTPEDADKRGIDFSQTRTAPLRLHEISFKYEWSRSRASPGLGSRAELWQEEPRSPRSVAHHRFPGLRSTSTEDRSVRSSINRDQGSIGTADRRQSRRYRRRAEKATILTSRVLYDRCLSVSSILSIKLSVLRDIKSRY